MRKSSTAMRLFGHAGRAAGFEDVDRLVGQSLGHPAPHRPAAEPFVLERRKLSAGRRTHLHFRERIELQLLLEIEPERAAGRFVKMPGDRFDDVRIEGLAGAADGIVGGGRHEPELRLREAWSSKIRVSSLPR